MYNAAVFEPGTVAVDGFQGVFMNKLLVSAMLVAAAMVSMSALAADQAVLDRYAKTCALCHGNGAAGAPKTGNAEQWAPRLKKGMDTLVENAKNGIGAMPPKGMCFDCSDAEYQALIEYMASGE